MPFAAIIPASSSKVRTKSTSDRIVFRCASSFFAAQGPTKHTLHSLPNLRLTIRPVKTIGVNAMEIISGCSGTSFFAIADHAGQQLVPMNGCFSGTSFKNSSASWSVQMSAPADTCQTPLKPSALKSGRSLSGVHFGPN